jgi:homoserine kinase
MPAFFEAALAAGALGAFLSGAGSTLLALVEGPTEAVAQAFTHAAECAGVRGRTLVAAVGTEGARIIP